MKEVNFEVAPKDSEMTYLKRGNDIKKAKKKRRAKKEERSEYATTISMTKLDKLINEMISQQVKLQDININSKLEIKKIKEQLTEGIRITRIQRTLHHKLRHHVISRLPSTRYTHTNGPMNQHNPLRNKAINGINKLMQQERLVEEQSKNIQELQHMLETIEEKHGNWSDKFSEYKIENFTIIDTYGVVHDCSTQYVDEHGRIHDTPLQYITEDGILHANLFLNRPSKHHHCRLVGHRRCHLPKKQVKVCKQDENTENERTSAAYKRRSIQICDAVWKEKEQYTIEKTTDICDMQTIHNKGGAPVPE